MRAFARTLTTIAAAALVGNVYGDVSGEQVYSTNCVSCHATGLLGAPKVGAAIDWQDRLGKGIEALNRNAIDGINSMPPKGGNPSLGDDAVRAAVAFMLDRSKAAEPAPKAAAPAPGDKAVVSAKAPSAPASGGSATSKVKPAPKAVNSFNRLLKPPSERNLPPAKDGIHDPRNEGTRLLQHPREAFSSLPKANSGNRVDWVAALDEQEIAPRFDLNDASKGPIVLDLNIVREVKGSMPDVVYPHKQHTEWLDCSNCHPSIFLPKKGANNISMAAILLGEKCGVCHGKVAFPVSDCRRCHSKNKETVTAK